MSYRYSKYFICCWLIVIGLMGVAPAFAQKIATTDNKELLKKEDSLQKLSSNMVFSEQAAEIGRAHV